MNANDDELAQQRRREMLALTVTERVELALKLGLEEIARLMETEQIDRDEAIRRIRRRNSEGRRPSVVNRD